ncbi:HEAT repeat domain-containing protein [Nonomuraea polychroma]|uniref:HEAT repeat domain-containing protein n=1 Tax=Nonomuraea polychroma TaxID=46176 RepID=UPI000FDDEB90|nr:HEAT repeat domain-containing protein [Nonomuraea polychroma]
MTEHEQPRTSNADPHVREDLRRGAALQIIRHRQVTEGHQAARAALDDDDPAVRAAAISALRALAIPDLPDVARALLHDPAEEVTTRAVWALHDSSDMTVADLAPLASSPHPGLRVTAIDHLRYAVGPGADELLSTALSDEKPAVRRTAVPGHRIGNLM